MSFTLGAVVRLWSLGRGPISLSNTLRKSSHLLPISSVIQPQLSSFYLFGTSKHFVKSQTASHLSRASFSSQASGEKKRKTGKMLLVGFGLGALMGFGYFWRQRHRKIMPIANIDTGNDLLFSESPPADVIAKTFYNPSDRSGLELILYQYEPCPFCKKVRAYLDYSGISYKIVEVNPVTKRQLGWSSYKKVPVVVAKVKEGYQQLNDSTVIISMLQSYLISEEKNLLKTVKYYPVVDYCDEDGKKRSEIMNRYFVMYEDQLPVGRSKESLAEERRWRQWADNVLMHTLSPNIYRTWGEALEAFNMFSKEGDWERLFSSWERQVVIHVGAAVMYMIGKRLKKRHNLLDDERQSLYQEVNYFLKTVNAKGTQFLGGSEPNLADLAVYGCLNSIEGTRAFADLVAATKVSRWYDSMKSVLHRNKAQSVPS